MNTKIHSILVCCRSTWWARRTSWSCTPWNIEPATAQITFYSSHRVWWSTTGPRGFRRRRWWTSLSSRRRCSSWPMLPEPALSTHSMSPNTVSTTLTSRSEVIFSYTSTSHCSYWGRSFVNMGRNHLNVETHLNVGEWILLDICSICKRCYEYSITFLVWYHIVVKLRGLLRKFICSLFYVTIATT